MAYVVMFWNATWALLQIGGVHPKCDYEAMARGGLDHLKTLAAGL